MNFTSNSILGDDTMSSTTTTNSSMVPGFSSNGWSSSSHGALAASTPLVNETVTVSALEGALRREVVVHGLLMYVPFGLLFPLGILAARFLQLARRHLDPNHKFLLRPLFLSHLLLQWLGIIVMTFGAILSFYDFGFFMIHTHGRLGLSLWILIWLQTLTSISRPNMGSKMRTIWYFAHWLMGTGSVLLGFYDFYSGIYMWEQRGFTSAKIINVCFSVSIALMIAIYFLQDRWENLLLQHKKSDKENLMLQHKKGDDENNANRAFQHDDRNNEKAIALSNV